MNKTILSFMLSLVAMAASGQFKSNIDSLEKELMRSVMPDTSKLNILNDLAFYYASVDPSLGLERADSAIVLAEYLKDEKKLASAFNYKGLNYASQGNDSLAIIWLTRCLNIHRQRDQLKGEAAALHNIGISYANMSKYPEALECQQQAFAIFKKVDNKRGMAATLNSIGVVYLFLSDYPNALNYYLQALHLYEKMNDKQDEGVTYTNIGLVYYHAGDYHKSLQYQLAAINIFKETGSDYDLQNSLINAGNVLSDSGDTRQAISYYQQAQIINQKLGNKSGLASGAMNIGAMYYDMKEYNNAFRYLRNAFRLYDTLGNKYGRGGTTNYLVKAYLDADKKALIKYGIQPARRLGEAMLLQRAALKDGEVSGNLDIQRDGWENMSRIYALRNDYADALSAYKKHIALKDSILDDSKRDEILHKAMQYEFNKREDALKAKKDQEKMMVVAAMNRQRIIKNALAGGAGILLIAGIISYFFYKRKRDAEEYRKEAELRAEITDTEMKALRSQMNPHFIFNSLNSISDYINKHDTQTADNYLTKFASLMRMTLENSEQKEISLAADLKALEIYMQLESLRLKNKFSYEIKVADNVDIENTLVPPLMLQPFVENSIWHGIAGKPGKGKILIDIKQEEDIISCVVEDNGIGRAKAGIENKNSKSFGMKITQSRIELLNKLKSAHASIHLSDLSEGMRVEMKLPLILTF